MRRILSYKKVGIPSYECRNGLSQAVLHRIQLSSGAGGEIYTGSEGRGEKPMHGEVGKEFFS